MDKASTEIDITIFNNRNELQDSANILFSDYKTLLNDWKSFQKCKFENRLKMTNTFPCNFYSENVTIHQATLSFITQGEYRLEVRGGEIISFTITLRNLQGYSTEGRNIQLMLKPELWLRLPLILEFQTEAIQALVFTQLENFAREIVFGPTLPSSDETESNV